ncbi:Gfo/Idh/MocA family protein [Altererythrobacter sp. MF3-039]|uniref:Gfo/Idh/MocA family protein n=1 Tax=Altererythrobacter sp. MF3-039 TaxID=3252901 RepID=UPI00390C7B0C
MSSSRYAIIGCGMMGREHMRNIALVPEAELVAIADPDKASRDHAQKLAASLNQEVALYSDMQGMLADARPDALIIAAPNHTHFGILQSVMPRALPILVEKPLCTTVEHAEEIARLARDYPALFWVGLEYRYMPPVTRFVDRVHAGEPGNPRMMYIREHRFPFLPKVGDWNRFNRNTGGTLVEKCCHFFDLMRHTLRDEPVRIFASGAQDVNHLDEQYGGEVPDILDNALVTVEFAGGARAVLDLCMFAEGAEQQEEIYVLGEKGRLDVTIPAADVTWSPRDRSGPQVEHVDTPANALSAGDHHGATYFQLQHFQRALIEGLPPQVSAIDGLRSVQMGAAAQQSIATGQPVELDFSEEGGLGA